MVLEGRLGVGYSRHCKVNSPRITATSAGLIISLSIVGKANGVLYIKLPTLNQMKRNEAAAYLNQFNIQ